MTEEIIKECKNCDALGIDSEIGVYYCCLSHRQDDLPKEFICDDYTPNKQLIRLEQENKKLKKDVQLFKCLDTFGESECHCACRCLGNEFCEDADKKINKYRSALEEIQKIIRADCKMCTAECDCDDDCTRHKIKNRINEALQ